MKEITAIIVDDEEAARNVLTNLLSRNSPFIKVVDSCKDIISAVASIEIHQPQVVFLDVQMPNYAGYEIVNFIDNINFEIIFVTAYDNYAIKAFELSAVDYLVKPINRQRLAEATEKLKIRLEEKNSAENYRILKDSLETKSMDHIVISELGNQRIVKLVEVIAIEANGAYSSIHLEGDKKVTVSKNLKHFEKVLPEDNSFFRSHKSWIINFKHIASYSKSELEIGLSEGKKAKLSKYKKSDFEALL